MSQTQLALGILGISLLYALVIGVAYLWRRRTTLKPAFAFATASNGDTPTGETQLLPSMPAPQLVWPPRRRRHDTLPAESGSYDTREVSIVGGHKRFPSILVYFLVFVLGFATGGSILYAVGSHNASQARINTTGWISAQPEIVQGQPLASPVKIFLWWDNAKTPNDASAGWDIIDTSNTKKPLQAALTIDASDNGQKGITLTSHTAAGDVQITGTLHGAVMQVLVTPNSHLFPELPTAYVWLTFTPATLDTYYQYVPPAGGI